MYNDKIEIKKDTLYVITRNEDKGKKCIILEMDNAAPRYRDCKVGLLSGEIKTIRYMNLMLVDDLMREEAALLEKLQHINEIKELMNHYVN